MQKLESFSLQKFLPVKYNEIKSGPDLWNFNKPLISDEHFTKKAKNFIENMKEDLDFEKFFDDQVK